METQEQYEDMIRHMNEILPRPDSYQSEWIFWTNVIELVNLSQMPNEAKADVFGCIMGWATKSVIGTADFWAATKQSHPDHQRYLKTREQYLLADGWNMMGTYWVDLVRKKDWTKLQQVMEWLWKFREYIFPAVADFILAWENDWKEELNLTEQHIQKTGKRLRSAKRMLRRSYDLLDGAADIVLLMGTPSR